MPVEPPPEMFLARYNRGHLLEDEIILSSTEETFRSSEKGIFFP